jgi:CO/xanthine dehydrogenase Mo-binding subunit
MSANEETYDIFGATLTRSTFVKGAGAMVVTLSAVGAGIGAKAAQADVATHSLDPTLPTSWFTIHPDNTILMRTGIAEMGQGSASTGFAQIAADELSVPYSAITQVIMASTDETPDGGLAAGMLFLGGPNIRKTAAYTYQALLALASTQFGVPVSALTVSNGTITGGGKSITYGQLVANQSLNLTIPVVGDVTGFLGLSVTGNPPVKPVADYQVVGQSIPMRTIPAIVTGAATYVGDVRLPGMLHARPVHPKTLGSSLVSVGTLDKKQFPNTQIIVKGNFVGVVDPDEYTAIQAAAELAGTTKWTDWAGLPGDGNTFTAMRSLNYTDTPVQTGANVGNPDTAYSTAATKLAATYEYPTEKHAPIGPTCAVGDVRSDGTIWVHAHGQNVSACRGEIALMMNTSVDNVIVRWYDGSGHYGRSNGGNTGAEEEAVILSAAVGKPVRVQWMRWDDLQWSTQHPPVLSDVWAGLDSTGKIVSFKANHYEPAGQDDRMVGAMLAGLPAAPPPLPAPPPSNPYSSTENGISDPWVYDQVPNTLQLGFGTYNIGSDPTAADYATQIGLRGHSMRTPGQRQQNFAQEGMINELAAAAKMDPIQFRLNHTTDPRLTAVLDRVRTESGWVSRPSPSSSASATGTKAVTGQGCSQMLRSNAYWACVAKVSVVPQTGKVTVTNITTVVDPGVTLNPKQLLRMAQGGATMGTSETLHEQVSFDKGAITDRDWVTFPILRMMELPKIDVVIMNNPSVGAMGSGGEGPNGFVPAAIAAAVFDATGKVPRRLPLTPAYMRDLLKV